MEERSQRFLWDLLQAPSVSGYEQPVQRVVRAYVGGVADTVETDAHGNVTAVLNADGAPRVLFAGHCDQIGFLVQHIEEKGYLRISGVGGHDMQVVLGQAVTVWTSDGPIAGVVARKPVHVMSAEDRKKVPELHQLWVDTGLASADEVKERIQIGDPVTYALRPEKLANGRASSPGMDDKVGVYAAMEAIHLLRGESLAAGIYSVSTVQEEIGLRGAITSAYRVHPQVGLAVDVTWATDQPDVCAAQTGEVKLGAGPVITRGPNINPVVYERLVAAAKEEEIPYQIGAAPRGTGTDANAIQLARGGVAAGLISIPNRYMHSPVEVCELADIHNAARLLAAFARRLTADVDFTPR